MAEIDVVPLVAADEVPACEEAEPVEQHIATEGASASGEGVAEEEPQPAPGGDNEPKRGRPRGKKDSQPRKPRAPRVTVARPPSAADPPDPAQTTAEPLQVHERVAERMREPGPQEAFEIAMRSVMQMAAQRQQRNEETYTKMIAHMFR